MDFAKSFARKQAQDAVDRSLRRREVEAWEAIAIALNPKFVPNKSIKLPLQFRDGVFQLLAEDKRSL